MKKSIILFALAATTGFASFAQERATATYFESDQLKPTEGSFSTEFGLTGGFLNSDFTLNEGASGLMKFRYFVRKDMALRLGVNVGMGATTRKFYGAAAGEEGETTASQTAALLNLGIEKHFAGTRRLSPYVGGDILFGINSRSNKAVDNDGTSYVKNVKITSTGPVDLGVGLRGVVGADFYVYKHVFIGAEAGLGFMYSYSGETKITTTYGNTTNVTTLKSAGSSYNLGMSMVTGVRIGFVF